MREAYGYGRTDSQGREAVDLAGKEGITRKSIETERNMEIFRLLLTEASLCLQKFGVAITSREKAN